MSEQVIFITFLGMAAVTYLPRLLPIWLLSSRELPPVISRWLSFVPTAVLSALLAPGLLVKDGQVAINTDNLFLLAAIPAFLIAWKTKSFFGTVAVGMGMVAGMRYLGM